MQRLDAPFRVMLVLLVLAVGGVVSSEAARAQDRDETVEELRDRIEQLERELERLRFRIPEQPEPTIPDDQQQQERPNVLNPQVTLFTNHLYRLDDRPVIKGGARVDERYRLRANEVDLRAAVGPYADGVAILAVPETPGGFDAKFEELYATINNYPFWDKPPAGLKVKLGRFRTEMGIINRLHTHDLPFITRPQVFDQFIGGGGYQSEGVSTQIFVPHPLPDPGTLQLTLQAVSDADKLRIASGAGDAENYVGNLHYQRSFARNHFLDVGLFGSHTRGSRTVNTYGLDVTYKYRPRQRGQYQSWIIGGEAFLGDSEPVSPTGNNTEPFGYFLWTQYQFDQRWYAGVRYDHTDLVSNPDQQISGLLPYVSYYWSEQLRTRLGYQRTWSDLPDRDRHYTLFFEFNFWFGSHPPHPYWVNR